MRPPIDDNWLAMSIGLFVLALFSTLTYFGFDYVAAWISKDARIAAAIIAGGFTLTGIVISTMLGLFVSWMKDRRERTRLASALMFEVYAQADMVAASGSLANRLLRQRGPILRRWMAQVEPPPPVIYPAIADKLVLLPAEATSSIIAFYGAINRARGLTSTLQEELSDFEQIRAESRVQERSENPLARRVSDCWKAASINGVKAIKSLRPYVREAQSGENGEKLDRLIEELAQIGLQDASPRH